MNAQYLMRQSLLCCAGLSLMLPLFAAEPAPAEASANPEPAAQIGDPISDRWLQRLEQQHWPAPRCLPNCVHIANARISANGNSGQLALEVHVQPGVFLLDLPFAPSWALRGIRLDGTPAAVRMDAQGKLQAKVGAGVHRLEMDGQLLDAQWNLSLPTPAYGVRYDALQGWEAQKANLPASSLNLTRRVSAQPAESSAGGQADFPLYARLTRTVKIDESGWSVHNVLQRLSPGGFAKALEIALLPDERPISAGIEVQAGKVMARLGANEDSLAWDSTLKPANAFSLRAAPGFNLAEVWRIEASSRFETFYKGIPQVFGEPGDQAVFLPFPGESLEVRVNLPKPIAGPDWAIESSRLALKPGDERMAGVLTLALRSLSAQIQSVAFPQDTRIRTLKIGGQAEPADWRDGKLYLQLKPGRQEVVIEFEMPSRLALVTQAPNIKLGASSVNANLSMAIPYSRWPLFSFGPVVGPAVLIWGLLAFLAIAAWGLSRYQPGAAFRLRYWEWLALLAPLCALQAWQALVVVIAVLAMQGRERIEAQNLRPWSFNLLQLLLGLLALLFLVAMIAGVKSGLLGVPDMLVAGGGSSNWQWQWYQDRQGMDYVSAGMVSLPMWIWKGAMLVWSFWIASRMIVWGKQAWAAFSRGGMWRSEKF